ncbi:MAG: hypothetical protein WCG05_05365 [Alphaproteobacteria bacterium]
MPDFSPDFLDKLRSQQGTATTAADKGASTDLEAEASVPPTVTDQYSLPPQDGIQEIKDKNGNVIQRIPYAGGKVSGVREIYSPTTQKLIQTTTYTEGIIDGKMQGFDADENLIQDMMYVQGQKQGLSTFYAKGVKIADINFVDDLMSGIATYYSPLGYVSMIASYTNNKLDGPYTLFNDKKDIIKKCTYVAGNLEGLSQTFYPSGALLEETVYANNLPQIKTTQYYESQKIRMIRTFDEDGKLIQEEIFQEDGALKSKKEVSQDPLIDGLI